MSFPRLSLRTWIVLPTTLVVVGLVVTLTALQFETLVRAWVAGSEATAQLVAQQVKLVLLSQLEQENGTSAAGTLEELKAHWASTIETDQMITASLEASVARAASIIEISITGEADHVLASSNRARRGRRAPQVATLSKLSELDAVDRVRWLFSPSSDFEYRLPIGFAGNSQPIFTIQVLVSNVLLRNEIWPGLQRIALAGSAALALAIVLVHAAAAFTVANLRRLGNIIDRMAGGEETPAQEERPQPSQAVEFAAVESKLSLLGNRVRGALHDAESFKQRVGTLLERLEEAILLFDGDRVALSAGSVQLLLGLPDSAVNGSELATLFPGRTELGQRIREAWETGEPIHDSIVSWSIRGLERRIRVNLDFIGDGAAGSRRLALLRFRDAEGAGEIASQLQVSSRLEAINRLTGGVAHEIKNPLNSIAARLALLESIVADEAPEATGEIQVISEEIYRLDRVVRTFLDFTQPLQIRLDTLDLMAVAREVADFMRPDATRRGIEIILEEPVTPLPVRGDRDLLKQAIMNLVVNGLDAMPQGGQLQIAASDRGGVCRLKITDTGVGIPEAMREKIFQLYFTTKKNGSGIGLASAYRTLQMHGGGIRVESETGKGSTFEISLPAYRPEVVTA